MPKVKQEKETRAIPISLETREGEDGGARILSGSIKFGQESQTMRDYWGDSFIEVIADGAFNESLKARDVVGLWSHDTSQVLGNSKSGTLRITNTQDELRFELDIPNTSVGNDAWELIKRGDVDGVSFGMKVQKDKWSSEDREGTKIYKRTILEADLYEISPVAFPAYPSNEVTARSLEDFKEQELQAVKQANLEERKRKLELELSLLD